MTRILRPSPGSYAFARSARPRPDRTTRDDLSHATTTQATGDPHHRRKAARITVYTMGVHHRWQIPAGTKEGDPCALPS